MRRRAVLGLPAALAWGAAPVLAAAPALAAGSSSSSDELNVHELDLPGDKAFGRAQLLVPKRLPAAPSLLVLLHGLGETYDQTVGAHAYAERYGLLSAVARLAHPPLERTNQKQDYFGPGRLQALNARLARRPFDCPILVCPYTPNPYRASTPSGSAGQPLVARYARFIAGGLTHEVEKRLGKKFPPQRCMLAGVSMGGYLALEIFLLHPERFGALGSTQGAFGKGQATRYAGAIQQATERVGPRRIEILTSSFDPYRSSNEHLHRELHRRDQAARLRVSPGPHDQRWLRESGMIEMLMSAADCFSPEEAP